MSRFARILLMVIGWILIWFSPGFTEPARAIGEFSAVLIFMIVVAWYMSGVD